MEVTFGRCIFTSHVGVILTRGDLRKIKSMSSFGMSAFGLVVQTNQDVPRTRKYDPRSMHCHGSARQWIFVRLHAETSTGPALQSCNIHRGMSPRYCITNASVSTQVPMRISCAITRRQLHHRDAAVPNFCSTVPPCVEKRIMWLRYFVQHLAVYGCASHRPIVPELHACIIAVSHYIGIYSCSVCWSFFFDYVLECYFDVFD